MREIFRLFTLVLFLIVITIFIGPLLILSAMRGQQKAGPLTFDSSHYNGAGRAGMVMLGLALWILLWGGSTLLALNILVPPVSFTTVEAITVIPTSEIPQSTNTPVAQTAKDTATPTPTTPPPANTPTLENTATTTPILSEDTLLPTDTPTPAPPTPTPTITPLFNEVLATPSPSPGTPGVEASPTLANQITPLPTVTVAVRLNITPQPTLTFGERNEVITAVREGNKLLREAVSLANQDNLDNLEGVWQGKALTVVENFATDLYDRYRQPFTVDFEYISPPVVGDPVAPGQVGVTSREKWSYGGPSEVHEEAFEFIYTLKKQGDAWIITWYSFRNLPVPVSTATPTNSE